jgi:hypothetical protein
MKVGDKVIVTKNNWYTDPILGRIKRKGTIVQIYNISSTNNYGKHVYRVYFYDEEGKYKDGCNVFPHQGETIELDIQETRVYNPIV